MCYRCHAFARPATGMKIGTCNILYTICITKTAAAERCSARVEVTGHGTRVVKPCKYGRFNELLVIRQVAKKPKSARVEVVGHGTSDMKPSKYGAHRERAVLQLFD